MIVVKVFEIEDNDFDRILIVSHASKPDWQFPEEWADALNRVHARNPEWTLDDIYEEVKRMGWQVYQPPSVTVFF